MADLAKNKKQQQVATPVSEIKNFTYDELKNKLTFKDGK
jgi:hypothetical protein